MLGTLERALRLDAEALHIIQSMCLLLALGLIPIAENALDEISHFDTLIVSLLRRSSRTCQAVILDRAENQPASTIRFGVREPDA